MCLGRKSINKIYHLPIYQQHKLENKCLQITIYRSMKKQDINQRKDVQVLCAEITEELTNVAGWVFWKEMLIWSLGTMCLLGITTYERKGKEEFELPYRPHKALANLAGNSRMNIAQSQSGFISTSPPPLPHISHSLGTDCPGSSWLRVMQFSAGDTGGCLLITLPPTV